MADCTGKSRLEGRSEDVFLFCTQHGFLVNLGIYSSITAAQDAWVEHILSQDDVVFWPIDDSKPVG